MSDGCFTLVFEGDIRKFAKNPLMTQTEFGTPYAVGIGDAFEKQDALESLMEKAIQQIRDGYEEEAIKTLMEGV